MICDNYTRISCVLTMMTRLYFDMCYNDYTMLMTKLYYDILWYDVCDMDMLWWLNYAILTMYPLIYTILCYAMLYYATTADRTSLPASARGTR